MPDDFTRKGKVGFPSSVFCAERSAKYTQLLQRCAVRTDNTLSDLLY